MHPSWISRGREREIVLLTAPRVEVADDEIHRAGVSVDRALLNVQSAEAVGGVFSRRQQARSPFFIRPPCITGLILAEENTFSNLFVLEYLLCGAPSKPGSAGCGASAHRGSVSLNVVPPPTWLDTAMVPFDC